MLKITGFVLSLTSILTVSTALADPLPVVAVNREVGLSMTGIFDNLVGGMDRSRKVLAADGRPN